MSRTLALLLALLVGLAPAGVAHDGPGAEGVQRGCGDCCCSDLSAERAPAALAADTCGCLPAPNAPPQRMPEAPVPSAGPAIELTLTPSAPLALLPRLEAPAPRPSVHEPGRAPPVRERLGVWLL